MTWEKACRLMVQGKRVRLPHWNRWVSIGVWGSCLLEHDDARRRLPRIQPRTGALDKYQLGGIEMTRKAALLKAKLAGVHNDKKELTRAFVRGPISLTAAQEAWRIGERLRLGGFVCDCHACQLGRLPQEEGEV